MKRTILDKIGYKIAILKHAVLIKLPTFASKGAVLTVEFSLLFQTRNVRGLF